MSSQTTIKQPIQGEKGGLVITRHPGKSIQVGPNIFVTFLSYDPVHGARLRIQAPPNITIDRLDQINK